MIAKPHLESTTSLTGACWERQHPAHHIVGLVMRRSLFFVMMLAFGQPVLAQNATDNLGACLVASTTGADRIALVKWISFTIIVHPAMADTVAVPKNSIEESDRAMGRLVSELLLVRCRSEAAASMALGTDSLESAFRVLGQVAVEEVMRDKGVQASMSGFVNYIDEDAFNDLMK